MTLLTMLILDVVHYVHLYHVPNYSKVWFICEFLHFDHQLVVVVCVVEDEKFWQIFFCVGSLNISTRWWCSRMSQKETREDCFHIFHLSCPYQMCEVNVWRVWERMWRARGRYIIIFQNEKTKAKIAKRKLKISNNLFIEILVYKCFSRTKVLWWLSRGCEIYEDFSPQQTKNFHFQLFLYNRSQIYFHFQLSNR